MWDFFCNFAPKFVVRVCMHVAYMCAGTSENIVIRKNILKK